MNSPNYGDYNLLAKTMFNQIRRISLLEYQSQQFKESNQTIKIIKKELKMSIINHEYKRKHTRHSFMTISFQPCPYLDTDMGYTSQNYNQIKEIKNWGKIRP